MSFAVGRGVDGREFSSFRNLGCVVEATALPSSLPRCGRTGCGISRDMESNHGDDFRRQAPPGHFALHLPAGEHDDITPHQQVFAAARPMDKIHKRAVPGARPNLLMSARTLEERGRRSRLDRAERCQGWETICDPAQVPHTAETTLPCLGQSFRAVSLAGRT
jgi:hypothetical protein